MCKMKVLVTGGAGFIGSHLVRELIARGIETVVLDNLSTGLRENLPDDVRLIVGDVRSGELASSHTLLDLFMEERPDMVVHLAAQTMVDSSIKDPVLDMDVNIRGAVNVLEASRKSGVKRIVFSSTAAAYGDVPAEKLPLREDMEPRPKSFYALSKVTTEGYLSMYHELFGLSYIVLRFANVYGERQGAGGEGGVISIFAKALAKENDITIFGDGGQTRDFIYADDVARAVVSALLTSAERANTIYNVSTETETPLKDVVKHLANAAGRAVQPDYRPARKGDIYRSVLSNKKLREALGWAPEVGLAEGLARTYMDCVRRFGK